MAPKTSSVLASELIVLAIIAFGLVLRVKSVLGKSISAVELSAAVGLGIRHVPMPNRFPSNHPPPLANNWETPLFLTQPQP